MRRFPPQSWENGKAYFRPGLGTQKGHWVHHPEALCPDDRARLLAGFGERRLAGDRAVLIELVPVLVAIEEVSCALLVNVARQIWPEEARVTARREPGEALASPLESL